MAGLKPVLLKGCDQFTDPYRIGGINACGVRFKCMSIVGILEEFAIKCTHQESCGVVGFNRGD
jgi:hypothetical protein